MSGTPHGKVDCKLSITSAANTHQEAFITVVKFMDDVMVANGYATRIASQYGASGSGFNYHDVANPAGENAFGVWRFGAADTPGNFFVLVQWAQSANFGTTPGNPGVVNGVAAADATGIAIAARENGTSPWAGGTANAGADAKGATVWTDDGSIVHVLDRACSSHTTAGSFATNRENCLRVHETLSINNASRIHCVGDADQFAILCSQPDDGNYSCFTAGRYVPRAGMTQELPLFALAQYPGTPAFWLSGAANPFGTGAGTGTTREGGILGSDPSKLVGAAAITVLDEAMNVAFQPNNQISPVESEGYPPKVYYAESGEGGEVGELDGNILLYTMTPNNHELNATGTRARMSTSASNVKRWSIPWHSGGAPGTNGSRAGVTF